jgi:hypothetical protein
MDVLLCAAPQGMRLPISCLAMVLHVTLFFWGIMVKTFFDCSRYGAEVDFCGHDNVLRKLKFHVEHVCPSTVKTQAIWSSETAIDRWCSAYYVVFYSRRQNYSQFTNNLYPETQRDMEKCLIVSKLFKNIHFKVDNMFSATGDYYG